MNTNKKLLAIAVMSIAMSACATKSFETDTTGLSLADERLNDIVLHADNAIFEETEKRLLELIDRGNSSDSYFMAKARAWLEFSMDEHRENEIDGTDNAALEQAQIIISDLENSRTPSMETPLIMGVPRLREDLWSHGDVLKQSGQMICAEQYVARLEVQLVWAGHEFGEMGWRHAEPYIRIAEQLKSEIDASQVNCDAKIKPSKEPDVLPTMVQHTELIANRVHFETDSYRLSPDSEVILGFVARMLKRNPSIVVELFGYADVRGNGNYTLRLSQSRANSVKIWLRTKGIAAERIRATGQGETDETTSVADLYRLNRHVEIKFTPEHLPAPL